MTNTRITGQNFLYALAIAFPFVLAVSAIMAVVGAIVGALDSSNPAGMEFRSIFTSVLYGGLFCWGPVIFIISFALLQRFRVKPNDNARN